MGFIISHAFVFIILWIPCYWSAFSFPPSELAALQQLYNETNGDSWYWRDDKFGHSWTFEGDKSNPCTNNWQGITCTSNCSDYPCFVQMIDLSIYNLTNQLPNIFNNLPHLTHVNISVNYLQGVLPLSLMSVAGLLSLDISDNYFEGPLPFDINLSCLQLQVFKADINNFTASIPTHIVKLAYLRSLTLGYNMLEGELPISLCYLTNLERLDLQKNNFQKCEIPSCIWEMNRLKYLDLSDNHFRGNLPSSIGQLHDLEELSLNNNAFQGPLPVELSYLLNLRIFSATGNKLNGPLPPELMLMPNLIALRLARNSLSGTLPMLTSMTNGGLLVDCDLAGNRFNGTFPLSWITIFPHMEWFYLSNNRLHGNISHIRFDKWKNLTHLGLSINQFTGSFPMYIPEVATLRMLYLNFNSLLGTIPRSIGKLAYLTHFSIGINSFTGTIPKEFGNCHLLMDLNMGWNSFEGSIPESLGTLRVLNTLEIYGNRLNGTIPSTIWTSSSISYLHLSNNLLSGSIDVDFQRLLRFHEVTLSGNLLSGNLSFLEPVYYREGKFINTVARLTSLSLDNNLLTGTLPALNFSVLFELQLQHNSLMGSLSFTSLPVLASFNIAGNRFQGCIPWNQLPSTLALFNVSNNLFECSLPNETYFWPKMKALDLSKNSLRGSIHSFFNRMPNLYYLYLSGNSFTGNLNSLFMSMGEVVNTSILVLDLSNNQFSSTLPEHLFTMSSLRAFFAPLNCLSGSLPSTLCRPNNLTSLILDGMGSSPSCNVPIFSFLGHLSNNQQAYLASHGSNQNEQAVLNCLFTKAQNLVTLHLSGLGIRGSLPSGLSGLPSRLRQLSLSNNYLTGIIPSAFFRHGKFTELDLSFNQLVGDIEDFVMAPLETTIGADGLEAVEQLIPKADKLPWKLYNHTWFFFSNYSTFVDFDVSVRFEINRLSGNIPASYSSIKKVNILDGNLFDCVVSSQKVAGNRYELVSELPPYDPDHSSYICGSHNVNNVMLIWIILLTVLVVSVMGYICIYHWSLTSLYVKRCLGKISSLCTRGDESLYSKVLRFSYASYKCICFLLFATARSQSVWLNDSFNTLMGFNKLQVHREVNRTRPVIVGEEGVGTKDTDDVEANQSPRIQNQYLSASKKYIHDRCVSVYMGYLIIIRNWLQHYTKLIVLVMCILGPLYIMMKTLTWSDAQTNDFITYHRQYLWLISACYMRGVVPTVVFGYVFAWILYHYIRQMEHYFAVLFLQKQVLSDISKNVDDKKAVGSKKDNTVPKYDTKSSVSPLASIGFWIERFSAIKAESCTSTDESPSTDNSTRRLYQWGWGLSLVRLTLVILGCMILIVLINGVYVFGSQQNVSSTEKAFLSLVLSMFKTLSNHTFMVMFSSHRILYLLTGIISRDANVSVVDEVGNHLSRRLDQDARLSISYLLIAIVCFSNVFAPYIAQALVGKSCFYYATLSYPPIVSSNVPIQKCMLYTKPGYIQTIALDINRNNDTDDRITSNNGDKQLYYSFCYEQLQTISYFPPFTYSYTCSSSLLTNFANVFLLRCLWTAIVSPVLIGVAYYYYNKRIHLTDSQILRTQTKYSLWGLMLPYSWKSLLQIESLVSSFDALLKHAQTQEDTESSRRHLLMIISDRYDELVLLRTSNYEHCGFDHRRFCVPLVTDWFLFLTLGVLLPPLGFCICVSVIVHVIQNLIWMRRYMSARKLWTEIMQQLQDSRILLTYALISPPPPSIDSRTKSMETWVSSIVSRTRSVEFRKSLGSLSSSTASDSVDDAHVQMVENPLSHSLKASSVAVTTKPKTKVFSCDNGHTSSPLDTPFETSTHHTLSHVCNKLNRIFTNNEEQLIVEWESVGRCLYTPVPYLAIVVTVFWSFTLFDTLGAAIGSKASFSVFVLFPVVAVVYVLFVYRKLYLATIKYEQSIL